MHVSRVYTRVDNPLACKPMPVITPDQLERQEGTSKALHGAPMTPIVKEVLNSKLQRSLTVLVCFKVKKRQSTAALPSALAIEIPFLADMKIRETMWPLCC